jgi:thermolysin
MNWRFHRIAGLGFIITGLLLTAQSRPAGQARVLPVSIRPQTAAELSNWNATLNQMTRSGELAVRRVDPDAALPARTHERLTQFHRGVPVVGGDVTRQLNNGLVVSIFGAIYTNIDLDVTPALSVDDARARMQRAVGVPVPASLLPELVVLPTDAGAYALAYRAQVRTPDGPVVYFVDARTGAMVLEYSNLQRQNLLVIRAGKGVLNDDKKVSMKSSAGTFIADDPARPPILRTYDMKFNLTRAKQIVAGFISPGASDFASSSDSPWTDGASVDAHTYAGWTYDYYYKRHGRRGLDNNNTAIVSLVHPADRNTVLSASASDQGTFYLNAFWDGFEMVYGDGLPSNITSGGLHFTYFSGALDVVAHELTHGVTQYTSNLIYRNESGALNEAFSDMMGESVEFYYKTVRGRASYQISEDIATVGGFRSMSDPLSFGDPDNYSLRYLGTSDNGGVHTNSGIANNAFYLAIEGGTNRTSKQVVAGVGAANREQIEKIFYRAFTLLMTSSATFSQARAATIQAAKDLYGSSSAALTAVTQAWTAVGVS